MNINKRDNLMTYVYDAIKILILKIELNIYIWVPKLIKNLKNIICLYIGYLILNKK